MSDSHRRGDRDSHCTLDNRIYPGGLSHTAPERAPQERLACNSRASAGRPRRSGHAHSHARSMHSTKRAMLLTLGVHPWGVGPLRRPGHAHSHARSMHSTKRAMLLTLAVHPWGIGPLRRSPAWLPAAARGPRAPPHAVHAARSAA